MALATRAASCQAGWLKPPRARRAIASASRCRSPSADKACAATRAPKVRPSLRFAYRRHPPRQSPDRGSPARCPKHGRSTPGHTRPRRCPSPGLVSRPGRCRRRFRHRRSRSRTRPVCSALRRTGPRPSAPAHRAIGSNSARSRARTAPSRRSRHCRAPSRTCSPKTDTPSSSTPREATGSPASCSPRPSRGAWRPAPCARQSQPGTTTATSYARSSATMRNGPKSEYRPVRTLIAPSEPVYKSGARRARVRARR